MGAISLFLMEKQGGACQGATSSTRGILLRQAELGGVFFCAFSGEHLSDDEGRAAMMPSRQLLAEMGMGGSAMRMASRADASVPPLHRGMCHPGPLRRAGGIVAREAFVHSAARRFFSLCAGGQEPLACNRDCQVTVARVGPDDRVAEGRLPHDSFRSCHGSKRGTPRVLLPEGDVLALAGAATRFGARTFPRGFPHPPPVISPNGTRRGVQRMRLSKARAGLAPWCSMRRCQEDPRK